MPMMEMFDKQLQLRMGQCNVKRWIDDLLPLVERPTDPLGVLDLVTHPVPLDEAPADVRDLPEEGGRLHQGRPQALTRGAVGGPWHHQEHDGEQGQDAAPGLPPLVLVTGDETLLVDRAMSGPCAAARRIDPGRGAPGRPGAGLRPGEFWDLVAPSLFAEPRVVVIRGAQEATKDLATALTTYCSDPVEGVTLLVHHAGGARNKAMVDTMTKAGATVVICNKITKPAERIDFVRAEIRRAGGATTPDAVAALVDAVGLRPAGTGLGRQSAGRRYRWHGRR